MIIKVKMWGTLIGTLSDDGNSIIFTYDKKFINSKIELSPIHMKLSSDSYTFPNISKKTFKGLPGLFSDSLPDKYGNKIFDDWLACNGKLYEEVSPLELLSIIGKRGMGALEYYPNNDKYYAEKIDIDDLIELSNIILEDKKSISIDGSDLKKLVLVGTSAGGARAKAIVAYNEKKDIFKSGQIDLGPDYDYYIIKFDGIENNKDKDKYDTKYSTRIEYAYYLMAKEANINISECRQYIKNDKYHFMTKRFDRFRDREGNLQKLHMQSLCALYHLPFEQTRYFSYVQAVKVMNMIGISQREIEDFYRRMVFNVIARNQDDHIKNISFLMDKKGKWMLSPFYDVTYAYDPTGSWTKQHQLLINGKSDNITKEDLIIDGIRMSIKENIIHKIISEVEKAISNWDEYAERAHLPKDIADAIRGNFRKIL